MEFSIEEMLDRVCEDSLTQEEIDALPITVRESIIEHLYEDDWRMQQISNHSFSLAEKEVW